MGSADLPDYCGLTRATWRGGRGSWHAGLVSPLPALGLAEVEPDAESLGVQIEVGGKNVEKLRGRDQTAEFFDFFHQQMRQADANPGMALEAAVLFPARNIQVRVNQPVQLGGLLRHIANFAVVREINHFGLVAGDEIDRLVHRFGIELDRGRGRKNELPAVDIKLAVGEPESIAGKDVAAPAVANADVVTCVPRSVETQQFPARQIELQLVSRLDDPGGLDGQYVAVQRPHLRGAINRRGAGNKLAGISHVPGAARMHDQPRIREGTHHGPRPPCVVEVDVRQDDVIDALGCQIQRRQGSKGNGQGVVAAGIHQGNAPVFDHHVHRGQQRADIIGVKRMNTMLVTNEGLHDCDSLERSGDYSCHRSDLVTACAFSFQPLPMMHFLADDGEKIHLQISGDGPPIVLLHGWTASHQEWYPFLDQLNASHRVFRWDARGHGGHALTQDALPTVQRMAKDLSCLLQHYDLSEVVAVGHSMGALTLWQYIEDYGCAGIAKVCFIDQSPKLLTDDEWSHGIYGDFDQQRARAFLDSLKTDFSETVLRLGAYGLNARAREKYEENAKGWAKSRE